MVFQGKLLAILQKNWFIIQILLRWCGVFFKAGCLSFALIMTCNKEDKIKMENDRLYGDYMLLLLNNIFIELKYDLQISLKF